MPEHSPRTEQDRYDETVNGPGVRAGGEDALVDLRHAGAVISLYEKAWMPAPRIGICHISVTSKSHTVG